MPQTASTDRGVDRLGSLRPGMRLPLVAAPMFLVSGPDLVIAACRAGIAGAIPAPNARSLEILDAWLGQIATAHAAARQATPDSCGPWALNLVTHSSYDRLGAELELVMHPKADVRALITALERTCGPVVATCLDWTPPPDRPA